MNAKRESLPRKMRDASRWLVWREVKDSASGQPRKVPYYANGKPRNGTLDTPEDVERLVSFDAAADALDTGRYTGLGFALGDGWQGIDLDGHVNADRNLTPLAEEVVKNTRSYVEFSPSGNGVHVIGYGKDFAAIAPRSSRNGIEAYAHGRFFTVTGRALFDDKEDMLADLAPEVERLRRTYVQAAATAAPSNQNGHAKVTKGRRNDDAAAWLRSLHAKGMSEDVMLAALRGVNADRYDPPFGDQEMRQLARSAARPDLPGFNSRSDDARELIMLTTGDAGAAFDACVKVLARRGDLYNRAASLVRVAEIREVRAEGLQLPTDKARVKRDPFSTQPVIVSVTIENLRLYLEQAVRFERRTVKGSVPVDCPRDLAAKIIEARDWKGVPFLRMVTSAPFLRRDGSIFSTPGFDADTGTLFMPSGRLPEFPAKPTARDVREARDDLLYILREFDWVDEASQVAFFALLFTLLARSILPTVPAYIITAPMPGAGKTLLADLAALTVFGASATRRGYPSDTVELRKALRAIALAGDALVCFDNVRAGSTVGGDALNMFITGEATGDRTLGVSEAARLVNSSTVVLTGNNLSARADFVRRTLSIRLDPRIEHPESRQFTIRNLRAYVAARRHDLLGALLTLMQAYVADGAPLDKRRVPFADFKEWDESVRALCMWVFDGIDPLRTQIDLRDEDPDAEGERTLFECLHHEFKRTPFTAADILDDIKRHPNDDLALAVVAVVGRDVENRLAYRLRALRDVTRGPYRLVRDRSSGKSASWTIGRIKQVK